MYINSSLRNYEQKYKKYKNRYLIFKNKLVISGGECNSLPNPEEEDHITTENLLDLTDNETKEIFSKEISGVVSLIKFTLVSEAGI